MPQHVLRGLHQSPGSISRRTEPFASARPTRIASRGVLLFRASGVSLPQHVLRGLHPVCPRGTCATAPFASARPTRIASFDSWIAVIRPLLCLSTSYADCILCADRLQRRRCLCLSTSYADCILGGAQCLVRVDSLPQHVLRGLHPSPLNVYTTVALLCLSTSYADCIGKNAQGKAGVYDGRCCESVDSFSIIEER